jgi:hypothetical protein
MLEAGRQGTTGQQQQRARHQPGRPKRCGRQFCSVGRKARICFLDSC